MVKRTLNYYLYAFLYYLAFLLIAFAISCVLISVITFFHFLLNHNLTIIDEWVFEHSWEILIISKLFAAFMIIRFISIRDLKKFYLDRFISFNYFSIRNFVLAFFLIIVLVLFLRPSFTLVTPDMIIKNLIAYVSVFLFYLINLIVINYISEIYPQVSFIFYMLMFSVMILPFLGEGISPKLFALFSYIITLMVYRRDGGMVNVIVLLTLFVAPFSIMDKLEPVWNGYFSIIKLNQGLDPLSFCVLLFIVWFYIKRIWKVYGP